jgi:hypothetical protein
MQHYGAAMMRLVFANEAIASTDGWQFSKKSKACIMPLLGDERIVLPPECVDWLVAQPDSLVSNLAAIQDTIQAKYTMLDMQIVLDPTHHDVIRGDLTRKMAGILPDVAEEAALAFDDLWGTNTDEWSDVCVYETVTQLVRSEPVPGQGKY